MRVTGIFHQQASSLTTGDIESLSRRGRPSLLGNLGSGVRQLARKSHLFPWHSMLRSAQINRLSQVRFAGIGFHRELGTVSDNRQAPLLA